MHSKWNDTLKHTRSYAVAFGRWLLLGIAVGALCGLFGALFAQSVTYVTALRARNGWLLFVLPVLGLASVGIYKLCRVATMSTNQVFESVRTEKQVPVLLAPAVFIGSVLTHLGGGSAGREGAALQLGGSIATGLGKVLRLKEKSRHILVLCGMGAFFSAIFGTPLGACVFALEVVSVGQFCSAAIFPCVVSSITAYGVAGALGVEPERFLVAAVPELSFQTSWKVLLIAIAGALVSALFCHALHIAEKQSKRLLKNDFLRIAVGGVVIILLTLLVGTTEYNGGGIEIIQRIFTTGEVRYEAFLLKLIFTVITVAAGFKGGEIIPSFFIGATLGGSLAVLLGLDPAFGAAVGMVALFCGVTNCPLATIVLSVELFGAQGLVFFAFSAVTSFLLSGYISLYTGQKLIFSKLNEDLFDPHEV